MIGYLLICFVDTERVSHNQEMVNQITNLVNHADIIASAYTLLFKNDNFESLLDNFIDDVTDFMNDPVGLYNMGDLEEDEYTDYFDQIKKEQEDIDNKDSVFKYEKNYMPLYIHFVSSIELFEAFCNNVDNLDIYNCQKFYHLEYNISCLDQMEILKKLQRPENDSDLVNKILISNGKKLEYLLQKFNLRHKN